MPYITPGTEGQGLRYFVVPCPNDQASRIALRAQLEDLAEVHFWDNPRGASGVTAQRQAERFRNAIFATLEGDLPPAQGGTVEDIVSWTTMGSGLNSIDFDLLLASNYHSLKIELWGASTHSTIDRLFLHLVNSSDVEFDTVEAGETLGGNTNWLESDNNGIGTYNYIAISVPNYSSNSAVWYWDTVLHARRSGHEVRRRNINQYPAKIRLSLASGEFSFPTKYRISGIAR